MVDADLRLICTQIYNDAMAQMQADSGNRIFPMALLPWWDVKESVAEAKRCQKMGLRGVNINSDPQTHGLPNLGHPHWNPLWWFERRNFVANTRMLGVNNIMFETDFPHPTCLYPDALRYIGNAAGEFTPEERAKVFGGNAARVYNIPIPK